MPDDSLNMSGLRAPMRPAWKVVEMSTFLVSGYYGPPMIWSSSATWEELKDLGARPRPKKPVPEPRKTRLARGEKVPKEVWVIVDIEDNDDEDADDEQEFMSRRGAAIYAAFERVAGTDYTIDTIQPLLTGAIPFACRNVLFTSEKQLYARVPDLDEAFPEVPDLDQILTENGDNDGSRA
jgi:hypothetical protein